MQARGPLMIEHRLIERMLAVIGENLQQVKHTGQIDPLFVDTAADFIRTYADRTHHGKEEDILFRELRRRPLSAEDRQVMDELIEEHAFGRDTTARLVAANHRYRNGVAGTLSEIVEAFTTLIGFYPNHIIKEDRIFFPAARAYMTGEEDQAMLAEFLEFDRKMIHEKYTAMVVELESGKHGAS